uniref:G_PROTEIN_RECEP_F1_2 domain-containing protein n=1 Tax=Steinernema glaseri TaxID=37863 RepID=A0A1I7ZJJ5_9BILA
MSVSLLLDYVESVWLLRAWFAYMVPMITISHIAMTSSSFLILAASFERYITTVQPNRTRVLRKYRRQIAAGAVLLGVITKISLAFEFSITFNEECVNTMSEYALHLAPLAQNEHYNLFWRLWFRNIITSLLPFFLLAFMNTRIVAVLQRTDFELLTVEKISEAQRKSRVRAATRTLLLVVFMYLLSNVLNVIVTIWEYIDMRSLSEDFLPFYIFSVDIVSLLTILAAALRLPIYLTCQPHLRREFLEYARTWFRRRETRPVQPQDEQLKRITGLGYTALLMKIGAALIRQPHFEAIETASVLSSCDSTSEEVFL